MRRDESCDLFGVGGVEFSHHDAMFGTFFGGDDAKLKGMIEEEVIDV